jgi:hypothetical protein
MAERLGVRATLVAAAAAEAAWFAFLAWLVWRG